MPDTPKRRLPLTPVYWLLAVAALVGANAALNRPTRPESVSWSALVTAVEEGRVKKLELGESLVLAELAPEAPDAKPKQIAATRLPRVDPEALVATATAKGVDLSGRIETEGVLAPLLYGWILPMGLMLAVWLFLMRRMSKGGGSGPLSFGRTKAKIFDANADRKVTFADVAGIDESVEEMREVVDFLKTPARYEALGAKVPKGVLLVGPPGTGKTLLARAVAGEAGVPFFSISGSDFVEMFVGVGAARVRDLFEQAGKRSPCIVFIDEIDAIGKSRAGIGAMATHDEREQTLNQLLAEMDGFDARSGIVIIAATNRPEVLDPALVRAGRFDRQVVVDRPSLPGRRAILAVHARDVKLAEDVELGLVARRTPGMVGADLAKVVNEAALAAVRRGSERVRMHDFEEAVDRIQLGLKQHGRALTEEEKRRVAFHESGHALVAMAVERADPVHRVTIIPRSIGALGATLQLPTEERHLLLESELRDRIAVMLGGRAAEKLALGEASSGAANDLERATETARQMVCRLGMSEALGPLSWGRAQSARFLDGPFGGEERNFSEATAQRIDAELRRMLDAEAARAADILARHRDLLERMTARLIDEETLDREDLADLAAEVARREGHAPPLEPTATRTDDAELAGA